MQQERRAARRGSRIVATLALVAGAAGFAHADPIFKLNDARGDDDGNGSLIYPNRDDLQRGDLDLVSIEAEERADGVWFAAELGQAIRSPIGRVTELGQTPMERIARNGFYTFHIDVYVDSDRVAGSGQTATVPGRGVTIERQFAWEKAIVLTPRPDIARTMLQMYFDSEFEAEVRAKQGKVSKSDLIELQAKSEQRVSDLFFFPTKVRVTGKRVEFMVPPEFLGGVPKASWGYSVLVTGADLEQGGRPGQFATGKPPMMTMTVGRGVRPAQWGIRSDADEATPPVIDVLALDHQTQRDVLSNYDMVATRLAAVPGIAPDGNVAVAGTGEEATPEQLVRIDAVTAGGGGAAPRTTTERRTVPARLRTLNELLADGLITQAEFNELRRKILAEL